MEHAQDMTQAEHLRLTRPGASLVWLSTPKPQSLIWIQGCNLFCVFGEIRGMVQAATCCARYGVGPGKFFVVEGLDKLHAPKLRPKR